MSQTHYRHRPATEFLSPDRAQRVHEMALRILQEVGLEVAHQEARDRIAAEGLTVRGGRVYLPPPVVEEFLGRRRQGLPPEEVLLEEPATTEITLTVGVYAHHVHDLESDRIVPYTCEKLVEMTKLVDVLTERGVYSPAPGYPLDVPGPLQPIAQYRIGALHSRHGLRPVDPISARSFPYVWEMAEALGHPLRHLPVYVFSPLRLAGESLEAVMLYRDRLEGIHVSNMASVGGTAPILPLPALAMAVAEVIGGSIVLSLVTDLPVDFGIGLHAFDLRHGSMVFGSPEAYLFGQLNAEINAFYGRYRERGQAAAGIHVRANFPGAQAAAEKASLMTAGALIGVRHFDGAGILAVDEVFSPEQLLVDSEIRDMVQRLITGLDMGEGEYDWVEEVRQGVGSSFIGLDSTLDHYREVYWHPHLFDRGFLARQGSDGRTKLAQRARDMVQECTSRHEYQLDAPRRREVERIWQRAVAELA